MESYTYSFKGKAVICAESEEEAMTMVEDALKFYSIESIDLLDHEEARLMPDKVAEELIAVQRIIYEFNSRNRNTLTDYARGYDKGYLDGCEATLNEMKGIIYDDKNREVR